MAPADNWLGPRIEQELKAIIEWKTREVNKTHSQPIVIDERKYTFDGSNLWARVEYVIEDPVVIQLQQVC
jgi:hypothetical protein